MFTPIKDLSEEGNWTLDEMNDRETQLLIPVIIFISIAMAVGTVGNAFVLYINIFIFKLGTSIHRHCIIFLALADITFCMVGVPFQIGSLTHPYTFTSTLTCKSLSAFTYFIAFVSVLTLAVVAFDRYRKICRPYGNQFSIRSIKIMFGIITLLSVIFSFPCFVLYGRNTVQTGIANITGIQCFPDDMYKDTPFPIGYNTFLLAIFVILTASMSFFYTLIWRQIKKHKHATKTSDLSYVIGPSTSSCTEEMNSTEMISTRTINKAQQNLCDPKHVKDPGRYINEGNKKKKKFQKPGHRAETIRVSKMLFVVTVFFVLSFGPFCSLEILTFLDKEFIETLDNTSTMIYQLFWRTFVINFMVNPFIYGLMDRRFRIECKKLVLKRLRI